MKFCLLLLLYAFNAFCVELDMQQVKYFNDFILSKKYEELQNKLLGTCVNKKINELLEKESLSKEDFTYFRENIEAGGSLDELGNNFLHYCAARGKTTIIGQFSRYDNYHYITISWSQKNNFGLAPIAMAIIFHNKDIAEKFISLGYDQDPVFTLNELPTVLGIVSLKKSGSWQKIGLSAYNTAVYFGNKQIVELYLAREQDSFTQEIDNIGSSLFLAQLVNQDEIYTLLKEHERYRLRDKWHGYNGLSLSQLKEEIALTLHRRTLEQNNLEQDSYVASDEELWDGDEEFEKLLNDLQGTNRITLFSQQKL